MREKEMKAEPSEATRQKAQELLGPAVERYTSLIDRAERWEEEFGAAASALSATLRELVELNYRVPRQRRRVELLAFLAGRDDVPGALSQPPDEYPNREEIRSRAVMAANDATKYSGMPHRHTEAADALSQILYAFGPRDRDRMYLDRRRHIEQQLDRLPEEEAEEIRALVMPVLDALLEEERRRDRSGVPKEPEVPK